MTAANGPSPSFTPEQFEAEADSHDAFSDGTDEIAAMLRHAAATSRRLASLEGQTCATCRFSGDEVTGAGADMFRYCRLVARGLSAWQLVPLVNAKGEPHGCNGWQAQAAQEAR